MAFKLLDMAEQRLAALRWRSPITAGPGRGEVGRWSPPRASSIHYSVRWESIAESRLITLGRSTTFNNTRKQKKRFY
jgi:hypothetical protein